MGAARDITSLILAPLAALAAGPCMHAVQSCARMCGGAQLLPVTVAKPLAKAPQSLMAAVTHLRLQLWNGATFGYNRDEAQAHATQSVSTTTQMSQQAFWCDDWQQQVCSKDWQHGDWHT